MGKKQAKAHGPGEVPYSPRITRQKGRTKEESKKSTGTPLDASQPGPKQQQQPQKSGDGAGAAKRPPERVRDAREVSHGVREALDAYAEFIKKPLEKPGEGRFEDRVERNTDRMAHAAKLLYALVAKVIEDQNTTVEDVSRALVIVEQFRERMATAEDHLAAVQQIQKLENNQKRLQDENRDLRERVEKLEQGKASKAEAEAQQKRLRQELAAVDLKVCNTRADMMMRRDQSQPNSAPVGYGQVAPSPLLGLAEVFPTNVYEQQAEVEAQEKVARDVRIANLPGMGTKIADVTEELRKAAESMGLSTEGRRDARRAVDLLSKANIITQSPGSRPGTTTYFVRLQSITEQRSFTEEPVRSAFATKNIGITWVRTPMQMRRGHAIAALESDAKSRGLSAVWVKRGKGNRLHIQNVEVTKAQIAAKHRELVLAKTERANQAGLGGLTQSSASE